MRTYTVFFIIFSLFVFSCDFVRSHDDIRDFERTVQECTLVLEQNPNDITARFNRANALLSLGRDNEALCDYYTLLKKKPESRSVSYNITYLLKRLGNLDDAIAMLEHLVQKHPDYALAHFSLSTSYLMRGDFERGWREYEWRWQAYKEKPRAYPDAQLWSGESVAGKTVLLYAEQGLGDTLQFIRYAQQLKKNGATVLVQTQPQLHALLALCPFIDAVYDWTKKPTRSFDFYCPLMSTPYICKTMIHSIPADIPYLFADEHLISLWQPIIKNNDQFSIGICWQGNAQYSTAMLRQAVAAKSLNVHHFKPLSSIPGVRIYNLQKCDGNEQLTPDDTWLIQFDEDFDGSHGRFMDTAAVMKNLDLIITVDTSIAHVAGGLGVPVWVLLPKPADWRWMLDRSDSPWYPTMRLFRQQTSGDWETVMQKIYHELLMIVARR